MSYWIYIREGICAVFLGFFSAVSLMYPHSLDGEHFRNSKGNLFVTLWGWPMGLLCGGLACYSVFRIYQQILIDRKPV